MSHPIVINSILWGDMGNGVANEITFDQVSDVIVTYSDIQGGWTGQGNISSNPLFKDAANGDYHLLPGSPCIDAANSDGAPTTDIKGNSRYDDPQKTNTGAGALPFYDMGAIEYQGIVATTTTTASGGGGGSGGTTTTTAAPTTTTTTTVPVTSSITSSIPPECITDTDCDDGVFCNGVEQCADGKCAKGQSPCGDEKICKEDANQCWDVLHINASSIQRTVLRPIMRNKKCLWLIIYSSQKHHFTQQGSSIAVTGNGAGAQGVTFDSQRQAFSFGNLIFIPVCVERGASTGQWNITIKTDVTNASLEETIVTSFQVKQVI